MSHRILRQQLRGTVAIVSPTADMRELEFEQIESAAEELLQQVDAGAIKNVVIDFTDTDFYGSTALAFFVKLWKRLRSKGGRLAFCNVSVHEREILEITHLSQLWPICGSLDDALAAVS